MQIFLGFKHWQLFFLILGVPFLLGILDAILLWGREPSPMMGFNLLYLIPMWIYFLWLWSVGSIFSKKMEQQNELKYSNSYFSWTVLVSAISSTLLLLYFNLAHPNQTMNQTGLNQGASGNPPYLVLLIITFVALASLFTALNYMAKILVSAERKSDVRPNDYFSEYVMAVIIPIGIWLLQPRINDLQKKLFKRQ